MKKLILITISILTLCACTEGLSKKRYLKNFEKFITEIEADSLFVKDLDKIEDTYEKYSEELFAVHKDELTSQDKEDVGELKARYFKVMIKRDLNVVKDAIEEFGDQASGFIKELFEEE